ncbi:hypothetical protein Pan241w_22680 [Gimesia alba]|uniref:Uncharacterized protein n=1 Tax=Gimesia alba TaxID=2527973 RepID=A0A517RE81_9PLAN|nr:hypothetical protein [Gimesia alba]QDT42187.1 hypothetical protein Pan241w_22680 [Gimesia alba]
MTQRACCPYCGERVSDKAVRLWDGRRYCRSCIKSVSPELYEFARNGGQLVDVVKASDVRSLLYLINFGKLLLVFTFLFCFLFWGLLTLIGVGKEEDPISPWTLFAFFGGGGLILVLLKSLILKIIKHFHLPRILKFKKGELIVRYGKKQKRFPLEKCKWYVGTTTLCDLICLYTGLRQGIVFQTPDGFFSCGHSPETLKHWYAFLRLMRMPRLPVPRSVFYIPYGSLGMVVGTLVGFGLGHIVAMMTGQERWIPGCLLLGAFEGGLIASMYVYYSHYACQNAYQRFQPAIWGLLFFIMGATTGFIGGNPAALFTGSLNGMIGAVVAWYLLAQRSELSSEEKEKELRQGELKEVLGHEH